MQLKNPLTEKQKKLCTYSLLFLKMTKKQRNTILFISLIHFPFFNDIFINGRFQPHANSKKRCVAQTRRLVELDVHNSSKETHSYFQLSYHIADRLLTAINKDTKKLKYLYHCIFNILDRVTAGSSLLRNVIHSVKTKHLHVCLMCA